MEPSLGAAGLAALSSEAGPVRVGTSGWSYPSWVGPFYPPGTTPARMLGFYGQRFGTVEAHSTHRRSPTEAALRRWAGAVPGGFHFAPKAHAAITHRRDLAGLDERAAGFVAALAPLAGKLGPILFVLPHRRPDLERLDALLAAVAAAGREDPAPAAVFELQPTWHGPAVAARLERAGASLAVVDRGGPHPEPPLGPVAYVRLRRDAYAAGELDRWAERLAAWSEGGRAVYAYLRHDEAGRGPLYAERLVKRLQRG